VLRCGYGRFCGMFLFIQGENNDTKRQFLNIQHIAINGNIWLKLSIINRDNLYT
jgi:hypothetical protein